MQNENPRQKSRLKEIPDHIRSFIRTKIAYYKLIAIEGAANAASGAAMGLLLFIFGLFLLIFLFTGVALLIGDAIGSSGGGFLIVAGFFLLITVLIVLLNKPLIKKPITKLIISKLAGENTNGQPSKQNNRHGEPAGRESSPSDTSP